jgi:hypothetical protein
LVLVGLCVIPVPCRFVKYSNAFPFMPLLHVGMIQSSMGGVWVVRTYRLVRSTSAFLQTRLE